MENILFIAREFNPGEPVSDYCKALSQFLVERSIGAHVVCFGDHSSDELLSGISVHRVPFLLHGDNLFDWGMLINVEFVRRVRELAEKHSFDIIHANDWITLPAGIIASKLMRKPLVVTFHSIEHERGMRWPHSPVISDLEYDGAREAEAILVNNERTYEAIKVFGLNGKDIWLINPFQENWQAKVLVLYERVMG